MTFKTASNGEKTCIASGFPLHSSYNPSKEAERFAETSECDFKAKFVLVVEPALSYCSPFLKKKFKDATLCCIRFTSSFDTTNTLWDKVFYAFEKPFEEKGPQKENETSTYIPNKSLSENLFSFMGEEGLSKSLFLSWKPSEKAFPSSSSFSWEEIKKAILKAQTVLSTRQFFSKRWVKNSLKFSLFTKKTSSIKKGDGPILLCASGPTLIQSIPFIKKYRERFFLIAVSSSIQVLLYNDITPDLCISTDGGFWAKLHLSFLDKKNIPLALPGEGSCFSKIMEETTIVPLFYGDGASEDILNEAGFKGVKAERNGSVSGTAAKLALSLTEGDVFFCGLDLSFKKGKLHASPNTLEERDSLFDMRYKTEETRISHSLFSSSSIEIYRSWFKENDFEGRLFRLISDEKLSPLGKVKDIDWDTFEKRTQDSFKKTKPSFKENKEDLRKSPSFLLSIVKKNITNPVWIKDLFPSEAIIVERAKDEKDRKTSEEKIKNGMNSFFSDIQRFLREDREK